MSEKPIRIDRWYKDRYPLPYSVVMRGLLVVVVIALLASLTFQRVVLFFLALSGFVGLGGWSAWRGHRRRKRLRWAEAQALMWRQDSGSQDSGPAVRTARPVSRDARGAVWMRDRGRCCRCGSAENLHFHRVIPCLHTETDTVENIQLMCANCHPGTYPREGACEGWHPDEDPGEDWHPREDWQPREDPREDWHGEKRDPLITTGWAEVRRWFTDPILHNSVVTAVARGLLRRGPKGAGKQIFGE